MMLWCNLVALLTVKMDRRAVTSRRKK
jgi:hypothetical protein